MSRINEADYLEACESYMGWCPACEDFTRPMTEPDVDDYDCPDCGGKKVHGAEQALLMGLIDLDADGES